MENIKIGYDLMAGIYFPVLKIDNQFFHFGNSCDTLKDVRYYCNQMEKALMRITDRRIEFIGLIDKFK